MIDAVGLDRFALLGISQGAAIAVDYAVRHPERVSHLVLYGGYLRGRQFRGVEARREEQALISVIRAGWTNPDPTFRHLFSMLFLPHGTAEQMSWYDTMQRRSTSASTAARRFEARGRIDVVDWASRHRPDAGGARPWRSWCTRRGGAAARGADPRRPPGAAGVGQPHPARGRAGRPRSVRGAAFLGTSRPSVKPSIGVLSRRELEVLELVSAGLTNEEIAGRLFVSTRTVERHLSNVYAKLHLSGKAARAAAAANYSRLE